MLLKVAGRSFVTSRKLNGLHSKVLCQSKMEGTAEPREIRIPVPYGHIAGKIWNEGGSPLLSLHGWMDNSGTWDTVAPLLPRNISIVAIDFPGHGFSSFRPLGIGATFVNLLQVIERVIQYFGWKEVNLLGHSMGGAAAMLYAGAFPEKVMKVIMVDIIKPLATPAENQPEQTAKSIKELLEVEAKIGRDLQSYEYSSLVDKLLKGYGSSITEEAAKILLKRGSIKHSNGLYSLNYDLTLKTGNIFGMTFEQQKEFAYRLNCELMIIKATGGPIYEKQEDYDEMKSIYNKSAKKFIYKEVEGTHHVHLNDPQVIAPLIAEFIFSKF
ncbi:probable serine hydrolase [Portunus trituberculatus]|uniref:probable serine hydrolase n=1 Tax=Portunus trituberculatus TaxID=210409 RepID=UPI001E1CEB60|nr:probable serine hydrolase [Portunus trituberculatus]XP_045111577.1 probable serine hydrolase [Portunus trituberculatus]XP_045111578.1 probable serine hydrolase [Portunus trituberculatus]